MEQIQKMADLKKYVVCSVCKKKIYFGDEYYENLSGTNCYCSTECFAKDYANKGAMGDVVAEALGLTVYEQKEY